MKTTNATPEYLVASDFDRTLIFKDSGFVLSEMLGIPRFEEKVAGLSAIHLIQQGAELAYLLRHDPEFRAVRREDLIAVGKKIRLKKNVEMMVNAFGLGLGQARFRFYVISASPVDVVRSALEGIVPPEHIFGTELEFAANGEISAINRVPAGYGKVTVLQELEAGLQITPDHTIYIGDGSSDQHVMQHVNSRAGHTIAVSEAKSIGRIAQRTVLSDSAFSVVVPILEDVMHWDATQIRELFATHGLAMREWDKIRTDWLTFHETPRVTEFTSLELVS
jgi:HAD superfamily phosphoserine phosphatase-like hydrolase